jgi:hypothetical protein
VLLEGEAGRVQMFFELQKYRRRRKHRKRISDSFGLMFLKK